MIKAVAMCEQNACMQIVAEAREAIKLLCIDQWQDGYPSKEVIEADIRLSRLYGAYDEQGLCAIAAICTGDEPVYKKIDGAWLTSGAYVTVHRLAASDRARGAGAAAALIKRAEEIARGAGAASVRVDTHLGNARMRRFLDKHGYAMCGVVDYSGQTTGDPRRVAYEKILGETRR